MNRGEAPLMKNWLARWWESISLSLFCIKPSKVFYLLENQCFFGQKYPAFPTLQYKALELSSWQQKDRDKFCSQSSNLRERTNRVSNGVLSTMSAQIALRVVKLWDPKISLDRPYILFHMRIYLITCRLHSSFCRHCLKVGHRQNRTYFLKELECRHS